MIGVFDSGYGGLTILREIRRQLPEYDYLYLGDNARTPYGTRSFDIVYAYTWQCVRYLFDQGCQLVILACNTASAKALRSIQQHELLRRWEQDGSSLRRVLGVIRPTVEAVASYTQTGHIGILATPGTVASESYPMEIAKLAPLAVTQQACPMWVPLIEAGEHLSAGADYFVEKYVSQLLEKDPLIDTIILGCTHYPLLTEKLQKVVPSHVRLLAQGDIVAASLRDYLTRHSDLDSLLSKGGTCRFLTTESESKFADSAGIFLSESVSAQHIDLA